MLLLSAKTAHSQCSPYQCRGMQERNTQQFPSLPVAVQTAVAWRPAQETRAGTCRRMRPAPASSPRQPRPGTAAWTPEEETSAYISSARPSRTKSAVGKGHSKLTPLALRNFQLFPFHQLLPFCMSTLYTKLG